MLQEWNYRGFIARCKSPVHSETGRPDKILKTSKRHSQVLEKWWNDGMRKQSFTVKCMMETCCQSNPTLLRAKKLDIPQCPNQAPDLNPIEQAVQLLKTKLNSDQQTSSSWRRLKWRPSRASQGRKHSIWSCSWLLRVRHSIDCKGFSSKH